MVRRPDSRLVGGFNSAYVDSADQSTTRRPVNPSTCRPVDALPRAHPRRCVNIAAGQRWCAICPRLVISVCLLNFSTCSTGIRKRAPPKNRILEVGKLHIGSRENVRDKYLFLEDNFDNTGCNNAHRNAGGARVLVKKSWLHSHQLCFHISFRPIFRSISACQMRGAQYDAITVMIALCWALLVLVCNRSTWATSSK